MTREEFLKIDNSQLNSFLTTNNFEKKYDAKSIKDLVSKEEIKPSDLFTYLNEANADFLTPLL